MIKWLKRARQTRTDVAGPQSQQASRRRGELAAYRATLCIQMTAQLLLWISLTAYDQSQQATWQAVLMLAVPLALLLELWRAARRGLSAPATKYVLLALVPCLLIDAAVLTTSLEALMGELVPSFSPIIRVLLIGAASLVGAAGSQKNGVAYGVALLRHPLLLLFLLSTVFVNANVHADRLWPILGAGLGKTALTALGGTGCLWGVSLLFALPVERAKTPQPRVGKRPRAAYWVILPLVMALIWALWYGMLRVWRDVDSFSIGERLMALARSSRSIPLCELSGLGWLLLLPCALAGCLMSGEKLARNALPKLPKALAVLCFLLPACVFAYFSGENDLGWLAAVVPYRAVLSAGAGVAIALLGRQTKESKEP